MGLALQVFCLAGIRGSCATGFWCTLTSDPLLLESPSLSPDGGCGAPAAVLSSDLPLVGRGPLPMLLIADIARLIIPGDDERSSSCGGPADC